VLLRQQYLTEGDSLSPWLGHTPKQQPLASHGSVLLPEQPSTDHYLNPLWGFARCRPSDEGLSGYISHRGSLKQPAAAEAEAADGGAGSSGDGQQRQQRREQQQQQQQPQQQERLPPLRSHDLQDIGGDPALAASSPEPLLSPPPAAAPAAAAGTSNGTRSKGPNPFAQRDHQQKQEVAFELAAGRQSVGFSEPGSAGGSCLPSRQASGRALLPVGLQSSSGTVQQGAAGGWQQQQGPLAEEQQHRGSGKQQRHKKQQHHKQQAAGNGRAGGQPGDSSSRGLGPMMRRLSSWRGPNWRRVSGRSTGSDIAAGDAAAAADDAAAAAGVAAYEEEQQQQRQQRASEAAAAAAVAERLGADTVWYKQCTGDPLLDRHVVIVELDKAGGSGAALQC
jgi:hypothetical protein